MPKQLKNPCKMNVENLTFSILKLGNLQLYCKQTLSKRSNADSD